MTTAPTTTEPIPITSPASAPKPQCEALFTCENEHLTRCEHLAVTRATVQCSEPGCTKAAHVKVLCESCAVRAWKVHGNRVTFRQL